MSSMDVLIMEDLNGRNHHSLAESAVSCQSGSGSCACSFDLSNNLFESCSTHLHLISANPSSDDLLCCPDRQVVIHTPCGPVFQPLFQPLSQPLSQPLFQDDPSPVCPISPESLAGDLELHGHYTRLFDCTVDASSLQNDGYPLIGCDSPLSNVSEAPTSSSFLQQHVVTTPQLYFQELGNRDPPYILFSTPNHDGAYLGCSVDGPEWTADRPITIHNQEYTSLADHLADLDGSMTFLNKYRSPESLKYDFTASPPYVPEYVAYDDAADSPMPALPCSANCSCRNTDWEEDDWSYTRKDDMCPDSPPYVPMDYNTLRPDITYPDDDKYYVLSPDYSYLDKSDMSPIPPLTLSPPSHEFDYTQFGIPTPAYTASS